MICPSGGSKKFMANVNLGACEWFVWDLRRSHLLENETLEQVVAAFLMQQPQGEPPALAQHMVEQKLLTPFQSERLLQGKSHDLVLGPYVLQEAVGAGSMGTVYRAVSSKDHKPYAVKVLPRRSTWNARMARRQVTAFEKCKHPAVVPFVDVGTAGAMHYLAWPFVEGESLQSMVQRQGKLGSEQAARLVLQVAEGLHVCHQNGLVHGMIKPSNLLVTADQIHILDFGVGALLAQGEEESLVDTRSTANVLASGLDCVSPESIVDPTQRTPAGDQYSLGCVLYYCLAGRLPFEGSAAEKVQAHRSKQPDPIRDLNPAVPEALAAVVNRLMQKNPTDRYADMKEVVGALRPVAEPTAASATPSEVPASPSITSPTSPSIPAPNLELGNVNAISMTGQENAPPVLSSAVAQGPSGLDVVTPRKSATPTPPELSITPVASAAPAEASSAMLSAETPAQKVSDLDVQTRGKPVMPVSTVPVAPAAAAEAPKTDKPSPMFSPSQAAPKESDSGVQARPKHNIPAPKPKPTSLPPGATKVLGRAPARSPSDYSVFDLPAVNDPRVLRPTPPPDVPVPILSPVETESAPKAAPPTSVPKQQQPSREGPAPMPADAITPNAPRPIQQSSEPRLSLEERLGPRAMLFLALFAAVVVFVIGYLLFTH
jgi:serine/threonine-protein kinase